MLISIHVENIALIRRLDIDFAAGFNVLTGETGAGKSILIDCIGLLLGDRFDKTLIRTGETEALVSGLFGSLSPISATSLSEIGIKADDEGNLLIVRQVSADGKSRVKINGISVSLSVLKAVGDTLIDILGQSEHQLLRDENAYIAYLDRYGEAEAAREAYHALYVEFCALRKELSEISGSESERLRMLEMLSFQLHDIDTLALKSGEDKKLYEKEQLIKGAERLTKNARFAYLALKGAEKGSSCYTIERSIAAIEKLNDIVPDAEAMMEKLRDALSMADEVAEHIYSYISDTETEDPTALLDKIESRLAAIERLKRKYGASVDEILAYRENAASRLSKLQNADKRMEDITKKLDGVRVRLLEKAATLHRKRETAAEALSTSVVRSLAELDMQNVRFLAQVQDLSAGNKLPDEELFLSDGCDRVQFFISANKGEDIRPLSRVASGGELSRVMLALQIAIAGKDGIPTLIFDEIDTGVSGKTARKLGIKLKELSGNAQVLCVTHSAQVASLGDRHLLIHKEQSKERTETFVSVLDCNGRIEELSRILGGLEVTPAQYKAAADMLAEGEG